MCSPATVVPGLSPDCLLLTANFHTIPVNEQVVRKSSPVLSRLMDSAEFQEKRILRLSLRSPNSEICLKLAMDYASTGELRMEGTNPIEMSRLADELGMQELQDRLQTHLLPRPQPVGIFPQPPVYNPFFQQFALNYFQELVKQNYMQTLANMMSRPTVAVPEERVCKKRKEGRERKTSSSMDSEEPYDNLGDVIIPSTDNEGWCRNKKYIEKTETGFMCTVCRKVYGRYNSVSYHVTIYHRNPPIKCDIAGCQFTTREARYIHFHKYYRHGVALPDTIDQGTRRCPYCRHVSKSPAMLDKHIKRHVAAEDTIREEEEVDSLTSELIVVDDPPMKRPRTESECVSSSSDSMEQETKPRALTL